MKRFGFAVVVTAVMLLCCGCGSSRDAEETGRYVETQVELKGRIVACTGMLQEGDQIRIVEENGRDMLSADGGATFERINDAPEAYIRQQQNCINSAADPEGRRIYSFDYGDGPQWRLAAGEGQEVELTALKGKYGYAYYGGGYFYVNLGSQIYQVDPDTGNTRLLLESAVYPLYMAADAKLLYVASADGVLLYDLEKEELRAQQDERLSALVAESVGMRGINSYNLSMLLYPFEEGVYVLTDRGLYRHVLYEEETELLIDAGMCTMGDADKDFWGMGIIGEEKPTFLICYSDGTLMRYTFDPGLPAQPKDMLYVYSLYEDGNVRQLVSAFRKKYPEISVRYEIGVNGEYGVTAEDAMKNLATELAAGEGPDILLMDDLPYERYVEKGALMELSVIRDAMTQEGYFLKVIDAYDGGDGLYAIPLTFAVPVLCGDGGKIAGAETLSDLADLVEEARREKPEGSVFSPKTPETLLRLLAQSSQGAWLRDGEMDREAVTEFLTQARRIYEAQAKGGLSQQEINSEYRTPGFGVGENVLERQFGPQGTALVALSNGAWTYDAYWGGFLTQGGATYLSSGEIAEDFVLFSGEMEFLGEAFVLLPGQKYGCCLAETLLAVNDASKRSEESLLFLEYALSDEFQKTTLNGTPVNRTAYTWRKRLNPYPDRYNIGDGIYRQDGNGDNFTVYWPRAEEWERLDSLHAQIQGVNRCDRQVYYLVTEMGQSALTGEMSVEEAVDAIEKKVQIYLAE